MGEGIGKYHGREFKGIIEYSSDIGIRCGYYDKSMFI